MVRTWFRAWGREKGFAYAERFRRLEIYHDPSERLRKIRIDEPQRTQRRTVHGKAK
jgi:hypothetical protein